MKGRGVTVALCKVPASELLGDIEDSRFYRSCLFSLAGRRDSTSPVDDIHVGTPSRGSTQRIKTIYATKNPTNQSQSAIKQPSCAGLTIYMLPSIIGYTSTILSLGIPTTARDIKLCLCHSKVRLR